MKCQAATIASDQKTRDLHGTTGSVGDNLSAPKDRCYMEDILFPVARSEEVNTDTFARKSSTWNSPSRAERVYPQH